MERKERNHKTPKFHEACLQGFMEREGFHRFPDHQNKWLDCW